MSSLQEVSINRHDERYALMFTGQGSQVARMGEQLLGNDLVPGYPEAVTIFARAEKVRPGITELCVIGSKEELGKTVNTQPAVVLYQAALYDIFKNREVSKPTLASGHSLGLLTALYAAESFDLETLITLATKRAEHMQATAVKHKQKVGMGVVVGLSKEIFTRMVNEIREPLDDPDELVMSNDNSPIQFVLSGLSIRVHHALEKARGLGARMAEALDISIPSHSPLMKGAQEGFQDDLRSIKFEKPRIPVYGNTEAKLLTTPNEIEVELVQTLVEPVQWTAFLVEALVGQQIDSFVEMGPSKKLGGMVKQTYTELQRSQRHVPDSIRITSFHDRRSLSTLYNRT